MMHREVKSNKSILYVAVSQGHIAVFHEPHLRLLRNIGYLVDLAAGTSPGFENKEVDEYHEITFARSPFSWQNVRAFFGLVKVLRVRPYTLVHCHTPVASVLSRLASLFARGRPVVLYTAHGFHFFPGAPLNNWLLWFSIEWIFTRFTDFVITINRWDEKAAEGWLWAKRVRYIPGIGIDTEQFQPQLPMDQEIQRKKLDIPKEAFVLFYIAEFIPRKNHLFLILSIEKLLMKIPALLLMLAGEGPLLEATKAECTRRGISEKVKFLGFRRDISDISLAADLSVSVSRQEGLPIGVAELMSTGIPVVASEDRGHRELVRHGVTGFLYPQDDEDTFINYVVTLANNAELRRTMGRAAREHIQSFAVSESVSSMAKIYKEAEQLAESRRLFRERIDKHFKKKKII